ncbi:endonuclease/exonuclease/phosphatase family protein [Micromonospora sp. C28SCA-DRY-2]|uniref:endonuclease/exonuclease/phosphatase family protein n=1 Tax=Micromonospora sp. C28SCA-DRY-2 TaxID=3059522 RepID=UPI0026772FA1|nr:endonuclease/exonuclease/phosphatase family protein [Micromonospora sp. C28SCA-DRY-2]MDO3703261.1 endonuclease/exonuclease/phosphatase family protein [Micromonospora sp. C28SCA-DRY-2]
MADKPASLRVLTLNVLAPFFADWPRRRAVLVDGLRELRPDVVALQEVAGGGDVDEAAGLLGPDYHLVPHPGRSADGVGAVLGSRWPVRTVGVVDLHVTPRTAVLPWSAAVVVEVAAPPPLGPVLIAHHKPAWQYDAEYERELQAVRTARHIEELVAERSEPLDPDGPGTEPHVVLLGDFDATPDAASVRFWTGRQSLAGVSVCYQDCWQAVHRAEPGHTFSPDNPLVRAGQMPLDRGRRIDYVLVRCGPHGATLDVLNCRRVFAEPVDGVWASDHVGVLVDLRLPPHPPGTWVDIP